MLASNTFAFISTFYRLCFGGGGVDSDTPVDQEKNVRKRQCVVLATLVNIYIYICVQIRAVTIETSTNIIWCSWSDRHQNKRTQLPVLVSLVTLSVIIFIYICLPTVKERSTLGPGVSTERIISFFFFF